MVNQLLDYIAYTLNTSKWLDIITISNQMFRFQVFLTLIRHKHELISDSKQHPNMKFYMHIKKKKKKKTKNM